MNDDKDLWLEDQDTGLRKLNTTNLQNRIAGTAAQIVNSQLSRIVPIAEDLYARHREVNFEKAKVDTSMPLFTDAEQQVRNALSTLPAQLQADPRSVKAAYDLVVSQDPELRKKFAKLEYERDREEQLRREEELDEEGPSETSAPTNSTLSPSSEPPAAPPKPVVATTALGNSTTTRHQSTRYSRMLNDDEKRSAERFGMSAKEYVQYRDGEYDDDIFGFKGRQRV